MDLSAYPSGDRALFLHNFTNNSFQPDVNVELTDWTRSEINRRNNFNLQDERATARIWLYGNVQVYRKEGRMYDNYRSAIRHELIVACRIRIYRNAGSPGKGGGGVLLDSQVISASVDFSESQGFRETEMVARARVLRKLSARINEFLEKSFATNHQTPEQSVPAGKEREKSTD